MTDAPTITPSTPAPDGTEWVIVKHVSVGPFGSDEVIGSYPTLQDAQNAFTALLAQPQLFTRYVLEHRNIVE